MRKLHTLYNQLLIIVLLLTASSCSQQKGVNDLIAQAKNVVEQQPDSALALLDAIQNPYELNAKQYAEYVLRRVQAKDKAYQDIASDTSIFKVRDYLKKQNDLENGSLSEFYCGRVLESQAKTDEAMQSYLKAKEMAEKINDFHLCGLSEFFIGNLNYHQHLFDEAIARYKSALLDFDRLGGAYKKQSAIYACLGNSFLMKDTPDSAFHYYRKGLYLAQLNRDSIIQINIKESMGVAFLTIGQIESAKTTLMQTMSLCSNNSQQAKLYLNLAKIYAEENRKDSALHYSNRALDLSGDDKSLNASIYSLMSKTEESKGNYQKSLNYHRQYTKYLASIFDEKKDNNILEIQKKYDLELLQSANKEIIIEQLWISFLAILTITILSFFFYRNHSLHKKALSIAREQIRQLIERATQNDETVPVSDMTDLENNALILENNTANLENNTYILENNKKLRTMVLKLLDTYMNFTLLEPFLKEEDKTDGRKILKKLNEIMYHSEDSFDWEIFYQSVNALYDDFLIRLAHLYPVLEKEDIRICCLSLIGFNNTEIALLIHSNQNIIQKRKTAIREKTGMKKQENFVKQLDEIVKKEELLASSSIHARK